MTNGREGSSGSGDGSDGKRRRPQPPILDLRATGVTVESAPQAASAAPDEAPAERAPATESDAPVAADVPGSGPAPTADPVVPGGLGDPAYAAGISPRGLDEPPPTADPVPEPIEPGGPDAESRIYPERDRPWRIAGFALAAGAGAAAGALALMLVAWLLGLPLGRDARVADSADRIAALEARLAEIASRPPAPPDGRVDALTQRVAAAEQAIQRVTALESRLGAAEAALKQGGGTPAPAQMAEFEKTTRALTTTVAELRRRIDEVAARPPGATAVVSQDIDVLTRRVAALEEGVKAVQATLAKTPEPDRDRAARLAAAAIALRSTVESGAPFAAELAAVRTLVPAEQRLAALEPFAAAGVPDVPGLVRELADAIPKKPPPATQPPGSDAGWFERVQSGFARLVRIRPTDEAAPAGSVYAPVQALMARGDLAGALAAASALPEAARAPLGPWIERVRGRQAALAGARELSRDSVTGLATPDKSPARQ